MLLRESTRSEYRRVFAEITPESPDALMVSDAPTIFRTVI